MGRPRSSTGAAARAPAVEPGPADLAELADHLGRLAPGSSPTAAARLRVLLYRLATVARGEPFTRAPVRQLAADMLDSGLLGEATDPVELIGRVPAVIGVLRAEAATAFGIADEASCRRLAAVIDELAVGFAAALGEWDRPAPAIEASATTPSDIDDGHFRVAFEQSALPAATMRFDGRTIAANRAFRQYFGLSEAGRDVPQLVDYIHPDDVQVTVATQRKLTSGEADSGQADVRLVFTKADIRWVHVTTTVIRGAAGEPTFFYAQLEDITRRQRRNLRLHEASIQDQLTRLPGQAQADLWLHRAFGGAAETVAACAVALDGFAAVRERIGPDGADRLLLAVAGRLHLLRAAELVARTGTDDFLLLLLDPEPADQVVHLADELLAALADPFQIDGHAVTLTASVGVAQVAPARSTPVELLRSSGIAVSWAKALGGGRRIVFDHERDAEEAARFTLLADLRAAIERREFTLLYQPLVGIADRALHGAEALVRWQHPDAGLLLPGRFIELAEQSGDIVALGRWILEEACTQAASWLAVLGADTPYVSVNVSPVQMAEAGWVDEVTAVLAATGLPADRLQLEITEQAVLGDERRAMRALSKLADAGVRLALDDFGTGYSSFSWLRRLPVHTLKIDGSFVDGLRHPAPDRIDRSIVRALIDMAHALELEVTAEWVETPLQVRRLANLGCDVGQGHWFGDPGPGAWVPDVSRRRVRH